MQDIIRQLEEKRADARAGGERLEILPDEDPFEERDMLVEQRGTDFGLVNARLVFLFRQDVAGSV